MLRRFVLASTLFAATLLYGQSTAAPHLRLSDNGSTVAIAITRPVSLRVVLDEFCRLSARHCEGTEFASSETLPTCVMEGTWREVLAHLFEGTALNYIASEGSVDSPGTLIVSRTSSSFAAAAGSATTLSPDGSALTADTAARLAEVQARADNIAATADPSDTGESPPVTNEVAQEGTATAGSSTLGYLPFPDDQGHPIPASSPSGPGTPFPLGLRSPAGSNTSGNFLPFADEDGNPMPVQPAGPGYPFSTRPRSQKLSHAN